MSTNDHLDDRANFGTLAPPLGRLSDGREVAATCELVCERVEERLDELLDSMQAALGDDRDTARKARADDRALTLRYTLRRNVEVLFRLIRDGQPLTADEFNWLRMVGSWSSDQGIARDRLVNMVQRMALVCSRFFAEEFKNLPVSTSVVAGQAYVTDSVYGHMCVVSRALLGGFLGHPAKLSIGEPVDDDFVVQLLTRTWSSSDALNEAASEVGASVGSHCGLAVMMPDAIATEDLLRRQFKRLLAETRDSWLVQVPGHPVDHAVLVLTTASEAIWRRTKSVVELHSERIRMVVVTSRPANHEIPRTYRRSVANLALARSLTGGCGLVALDELDLYHLVTHAGPLEHQRFVAETLGGWFEASEGTSTRLLTTLRALLTGNGKTSDVAEELFLDIKTVQNHLRQIRRLTGLDVKVPAHRFRLQLALMFWRLYAEDLPAVGDTAWSTQRNQQSDQ